MREIDAEPKPRRDDQAESPPGRDDTSSSFVSRGPQFSPPAHVFQAWATLRIYRREKALNGQGDRAFLERMLHGLMLNFGWWVNRRDRNGRNLFEGGFLGLDNISILDRSELGSDG